MSNNPFTKVKATGTSNSKSKKEHTDPKQTEISINFKQPIRITRTGIEQPKMKVVNATRIVHIIQRKAPNKAEQPKPQYPNGPVHVIQASNDKKGWKFNMDDLSSESHQQPQFAEKVPSERYSVKIEEKILNQEVVPVAIPLSVTLDELQESLNYPQNKMTYQRKLERAESISNIENSQKSSQSIMEESSAHHIEFKQQERNNSEQFEQVFIPDEIQEKIGDNAVKNQKRRFWILQKPQTTDQKSNIASNIFIFQDQQNILLSNEVKRQVRFMSPIQFQNAEQQQKVLSIPIQAQIQKIEVRSVSQEMKDARKSSRIYRKLLILENVQEKMKVQSLQQPYQKIDILSIEQHLYNSNKLSKIYRHFMIIQDNLKEDQPKSILLLQPVQNINIQSVQQSRFDKLKSSKLYRSILTTENLDKNSKISNFGKQQLSQHKIDLFSIEEELNPSNHLRFRRQSYTMKRDLRINQAENLQRINSFIAPIEQELPLNAQHIEISQISQNISSKSNKSKQIRHLLLIEGEKNKFLAQQIIIPQQFSQKMNDSTKINEHHKRSIRNLKPTEVEQVEPRPQQPQFDEKLRQNLNAPFKKEFQVKPIDKNFTQVKPLKKFKRPQV